MCCFELLDRQCVRSLTKVNFLNASTVERCFSCKRKPKRYPQRVDVGADIERRVFKLFRAGECRCTNKSVMGQRLQIGLSVNCLSQPEVDYFYGREGAARHCYHFVVVRSGASNLPASSR